MFKSPSPKILSGPSSVVIIPTLIREARVTSVLAGNDDNLLTFIIVYFSDLPSENLLILASDDIGDFGLLQNLV